MRPLPPAAVTGIVEIGLYVSDLASSSAFYRKLFDARALLDVPPRLVALAIAEKQVLLLFQKGHTEDAVEQTGGTVPGHGASGVQHVAFSIDADQIPAWLARLEAMGLAVESRVTWNASDETPADRAGRSIYFRDPDGHSIELLTPGLWKFGEE